MKIYYIGDSTVAYHSIHTYPQTGMSQGLARYVKPEVPIISLAKNGRSTKSFLDEGLFAPAEEGMVPGDLLLIQFGHNDEKPDTARHTDPETSFRANLLYFVRIARERGAYPVLVTPIARRIFVGEGNFLPGSHGDYPDAMRKLGKDAGVPVVDLTSVTESYLTQLGDEASKPLFMWPKDNTHLKPEGAVTMAGLLSQGLAALGEPYSAVLFKREDEGACGVAAAANCNA